MKLLSECEKGYRRWIAPDSVKKICHENKRRNSENIFAEKPGRRESRPGNGKLSAPAAAKRRGAPASGMAIMMSSGLLVLLTGCVQIVHELKSGPFPVLVQHQSRATGVEATIPNQAGGALIKFRIGFFSDSEVFMPCSTNELYCPSVANDFVLGDTFSFTPSVTIKESSAYGYKGAPPPPRFPRMMSPKAKDLDDKKP
jgi:hypothetical protein